MGPADGTGPGLSPLARAYVRRREPLRPLGRRAPCQAASPAAAAATSTTTSAAAEVVRSDRGLDRRSTSAARSPRHRPGRPDRSGHRGCRGRVRLGRAQAAVGGAAGGAGRPRVGGCRRRKGERRQLADDRAGLDASILVLVAGGVQLERSHVPRRARHLAGSIGWTARGAVPVRRLGEMATPGEEHGREPVERKRTRKSAELLPFGDPEWVGPLIEVIVPPQIVRRRGAAE